MAFILPVIMHHSHDYYYNTSKGPEQFVILIITDQVSAFNAKVHGMLIALSPLTV